MFFSSFSSSSFLCLGITLVLIGILGYLISRKFQEQNHKITTMCELVTTMAQDLQMLKMQNAVDKIQNTLHTQSAGNLSQIPNLGTNDSIFVDRLGYIAEQSNNKIVVSDDEESYGEDDESNGSSLEDFDDMEELDEEDVGEAEVDLDLDVEVEEEDDIEITEIFEPQTEVVNVDISIDEPVVETKHIEINIEPETLVEHHAESDNHPHIVVNKLDETFEESIELSTNNFTDNPPSNINKPKKSKPSRSLPAEDNVDSIENLENFTGDYSKLNVTQLRKLVTDRGLSTHATKLKKTDLLQLLGGGITVVELENIDM